MSLSEDLHPRRVLLALFGALTLLVIAGARPTNAQDAPIDNLERASAAVVRIEAVGTFIDFYEGEQQNIPGYGSGFIIDPSGLVVTNNHVVTGGALYRVYVGGSSRPVNARVVGVSECSDLAVIDLQGEGYPYLAWSDLRPLLGKRVFAAGYPLGDPEYKLTSGKIKSAQEDGSTDWASIDRTIEHSVRMQPGNSGGPLLDSYGSVMAVNYAGNDDGEYFAIPAAIAEPLAKTLATGVDVDSLGINGVVVTSDDESGIWISSIASGTPADRLGLVAGDIILKVEGVDVGMDGTMRDYCDIIQSHTVDDVMGAEVYRPASDEILTGQFNGRDLVVIPFDNLPVGSQTTTPSTDYRTVRDSSGAVSFDVPDLWTDTNERPWNWDGTVVGSQLIVAPNVEGFLKDWGVPGVAFSWSSSLQATFTTQQIVRALDLTDDCAYSDYDSWDDSKGLGYSAFYADCPNNMVAVVAAFEPPDAAYVYKYELWSHEDDFEEVFARIADSHVVYGDLPGSSTTAIVTDVSAPALNLVVDEGRRIFVTVPPLWKDVVSEPIEDEDGVLGTRLTVAEDSRDFRKYWGESGIDIRVYDEAGYSDVDEWLDIIDYNDDCTYGQRYPFESEYLTGRYELWFDCGAAAGSTFLQFALRTKTDTDMMVTVHIGFATDAESEVLTPLMDSLAVLGGFAPGGLGETTVTVVADTLNIRTGPGTAYDLAAQLTRGSTASAVGQSGNCAWYLLEDANGKRGWVSGDPQYTRLNGNCADLPSSVP